VVRAVVEGAATALHTGYASVLLVDAADEGREGEGGEVRERGVHGFLYDPLLAGSSAGDGAAFLGLLRAEGPVIVDGTGPPGVLDAIRAREAGVFAAVAAPLRVRGEAQGLLVVYWVGGGPVPGEAAVRFLGALAAGAAVALENARLHARLGRFNRELEGRVAERTRDLEKALRELRALDRLKDDFLSSMSHELMTPLAGVRSSAEILRSYADLSQQEREDFLLGIEHETDRLSDRLQDILDLAAFDAGKVVLQRDPANVREVLVAALEKARPAFEARRLKTQLWLPQAELPRLPCDRRWLDRALAHVLDNAAKFSPEGAEVVVSGESDGKAIVFRVRDRGPGIRPEDRESLFQRFKQLGSVETDKPPGIGAGLPLVRRIAEAHGGTVGLEGGPGLGTLVELRLPLT